MTNYYFMKEDFVALEKLIKNLQRRIVELGKEQGVAVNQSTENFGHDDAVQEVVEQDRRIVISRINEMKKILNKAKIIEPLNTKEKIRFGSVVELSTGKKYQIGSYRILAQHSIENISYNSPLGQKLISKEMGDEIVHNGTIITILDIK